MHIPKQALGKLATAGMVWSALGTLISKFASFGAQLVLGWVLSTEDFGLYAIALSWTSIVIAMRNAGTQRFLIQRGSAGGYDEFAGICFKVALLFNGIGFIILALAAPVLAQFYENRSLSAIVWIIALALPLNTASLIFQAKLSSEMSFAKLTQINVWSAFLRHGSMAAFALAGLGPLSFVLPLILIALFETLVGWYVVGLWSSHRRLTWSAMCEVLRESRWVMLTTLAGILVMNGDYLAISFLQNKEILGIYYFGFQLSFSLAILFTNSVETVMMPTFSRLHHDQGRQKEAFFRAARVLMLGATLACFALVLAATPLIHGLWGGKWDQAISVVQLLALSLPVKLVVPLCRSLIEGRGEWRFASMLLLADGIGTFIAGGIGAWFGGLLTIAAVVSGYNLVLGLTFCGIVAKRIGGSPGDLVVPMVSTFALGLLSLSTAEGCVLFGLANAQSMWHVLGLIVLYSAVFAGSATVFLHESVTEIMALISRQLSGVRVAGRTS